MRDDSFLAVHRQFRTTLWIAFFVFLTWAYFSELDVVATAQGGLVQDTVLRAEDGVVPKREALRMEGWVVNEDAFDVVPGMPALVMAVAYPQSYGWVEGEVVRVWADYKAPETTHNAKDEPPVYRISFALKRQSLSGDGHVYELKPGMSAYGVVQMGKRTVLDYLTSPVRKVLREAAMGP